MVDWYGTDSVYWKPIFSSNGMMEMNRSVVLLIILLALICGCNDRTSEADSGEGDSLYTHPGLASVQLPGVLIAPDGDTVQSHPGVDVILYYWIPLDKYDEMLEDLRFLASLDSTYLVLPLQPDHESRNHAQRVVNNLEITLPVFLADSAVMVRMNPSILPICLFLTPEGDEVTETGFGAPSRILTAIDSGV